CLKSRRCDSSLLHDPGPAESSTRSLHDALPILLARLRVAQPLQRLVLLGRPQVLLDAGAVVDENVRLQSARQRDERVGLPVRSRSEEHTSELQSRFELVCRLLLEKKKLR